MAPQDPVELNDAAKRAFALQDYGPAPEIGRASCRERVFRTV